LIFTAFIIVVALNLNKLSSILSLSVFSVPFLIIIVAGQVAESLVIQVLTAREQSARLLSVVGYRSIASMAATVLLLYTISSEKYLAVIYAESLSSLFLIAYLLKMLRNDMPWTFSRAVLKDFIGYSIPLIPYMLSLTLISQFDRVMIDREFGKEITGIYSISYNLGILLIMVSGAMLNALNPRFFKAMEAKRYDDVIRDTGFVFSVCAFCAFFMALFGPQIATFCLSQRYASGFGLIPAIALGGLASVVFQMWGRIIFYTTKTYLLSLIASAATLLKIGLNLFFLPVLGYQAAAATTFFTYLFMAVAVIVLINFKLKLLRVNVTKEVLWLGILSVVVVVESMIEESGMLVYLCKGSVLIAVFLMTLRSFKVFLQTPTPTQIPDRMTAK
jgi:O-antigen/teichoic acid export membrane protein